VMVYDAAHQRAVLFGGRGTTGLLDDTWTWDGAQWAKQQPVQSPPKRSHHAMAYDPIRERVVLFGGVTGTATLGADTWEWDGSAWTQITTPIAPPPRSGASLVHDPLRQRLVLTGGTDAPLNYATFGDWWEWDGAMWARQGADPRIARSGHVGFFDRVRGGVAVFSGIESALATAQPTAELWLLRYRAD
jgi:hypothetical protein